MRCGNVGLVRVQYNRQTALTVLLVDVVRMVYEYSREGVPAGANALKAWMGPLSCESGGHRSYGAARNL